MKIIVDYNILHLFSGIFINVDAIIYLQLCSKNQVKKGCKTQVNSQILISQEMTSCFKIFFFIVEVLD